MSTLLQSGMGKATSGTRAQPLDRRRSRSLVSRQALVAAAIRSIAANGLAETTLARVSALSGLSRSLVAFHFESKDALIRAALVEANRRYDASWRETLDGAGASPRARLDAAIRHDIGFAERHAELLHVWFAIWGETQAHTIYRELALPMDRRYLAELTELARAAGLPARAAQDAGRIINSFLYGSWLEAHLDPGSFHVKRTARAGIALLDALVPA